MMLYNIARDNTKLWLLIDHFVRARLFVRVVRLVSHVCFFNHQMFSLFEKNALITCLL